MARNTIEADIAKAVRQGIEEAFSEFDCKVVVEHINLGGHAEEVTPLDDPDAKEVRLFDNCDLNRPVKVWMYAECVKTMTLGEVRDALIGRES